MRFLLIAILVYLAYQFIFNFLIPVFIAARRIRKGFKEMSAGMNHTGNNSQTQTSNFSSEQGFTKSQSSKPGNKGDYLDFEEIK